ncbi:MAG TPA: polysaccharide biosynthesis/export family protein, partial [Pyrinomonadaceae bacterium]|nr:polysaccharide biosynthesis/export family protein [Pyrinomonadaceae bacterium]
VLFAFVFGLVVCVPFAATANAQSRLGPSEDDSPVVSSSAAKGEAKKNAVKSETPARPAPKSEPKSEAREDVPKGDAAKSEAQKTPTVLTSAAAPNPNINTSATPNTTSDGAPKTTGSPLPVFGSPSVLGIPAPPKYEPPAPLKTSATATGTSPAPSAATSTTSAPATAALPPTAIYRVGVGDILDIRLTGGMSKDSTLYTILSTGMLDYPLAGEPFNAVGMTTDEVGARLSAELKRRGVYDRAQFRIVVREYASHTATVSGLVDQPGAKILRREAVPLYVVLSEANPRADAGRAVIISRATGRSKTIDLSDSAALNELISHGDIINITARPQEFFYIGGQINAPGQKDFHPGMTLTQAILASGGVARDAGSKVKVTVSRQGADGRLVATEFLLNDIETGQVPDPRLQAGDRVEVGRRR